MKTLFVVLPFVVENYVEAIEQITFAVENMLGMHLQSMEQDTPYFGIGCYFEKNTPCETEQQKERTLTKQTLARLRDYMSNLISADYIAFTPDWREHKETILLHGIACAYGLKVIELEAEALKEEEKMKACPFCGGVPEFHEHVMMGSDGKPMYYLQCSKCFVSTPPMKNQAEALSVWNTRATEEEK